MSWFQRLERAKGMRAGYSPADDYWYNRVLLPTASGQDVDEDVALGITAFWCGVNLIADAMADSPLRLYRRTARGGTTEAREDRRFWLLHLQPNDWQTTFTWRKMSQGHLLLRGNCYAQKVLRRDGSLEALVPLHPTRTVLEVDPEDGSIWYRYGDAYTGKQRLFPAREVLHVRGLSTNGLVGYSPVTVLREALGAIVATDRYSAHFFKNNAQPAGVVTSPTPIHDAAFKRLKDEWKATHSGGNESGTAFLDSGMEFQAIGFSAEDSQLVNSRTFNIQEVARVLNIPPHKLKELSRSTYSNIEHQGIEWVVDTVQPWVVNWEQQLNVSLLSEREQSTLFFKFDLKGQMRGDATQRAAYMQTRFNMGSLSANEIRELEEEDPIEGGDRYWVQQNLMPVDLVDEVLQAKLAPPAPPPAQLAPPASEPQPSEADQQPQDFSPFRPVLHDCAARLLYADTKAVRRAAKRGDWTAFRAWLDTYAEDAVAPAAQRFLPVASAMAAAAGLTEPERTERARHFALAAATDLTAQTVADLRAVLLTAHPDTLADALEHCCAGWLEVRSGALASELVAGAAEHLTPLLLEATA